MFKSKEELIGNNEIYRTPINDAFKSFAERVEFYKKWKDNPNGLAIDGTNIFNRFADWFNENYGVKHIRTKTFDDKFNDWLFDYSFKDVIE